MKKLSEPKNLSLLVLVSGLGGLLLHWLTFETAMDENGLLVPGSPVVLLLGLLSAAVAALIGVVTVKLKGTGTYQDNFPPSGVGAAGCFVLAVCMAGTVLVGSCPMGGGVQDIWIGLGLTAALALIIIGFCRLMGKAPFFLCHLPVGAFFALHLVTYYQTWSGMPQVQEYLFTMLGTMALICFSYYHMAFDVGLGKRRMLLASGQAAVYLSLVNLYDTPCKVLYLGSVIWVLTNLCAFRVPGEKHV